MSDHPAQDKARPESGLTTDALSPTWPEDDRPRLRGQPPSLRRLRRTWSTTG
jgi:hypothetical protein